MLLSLLMSNYQALWFMVYSLVHSITPVNNRSQINQPYAVYEFYAVQNSMALGFIYLEALGGSLQQSDQSPCVTPCHVTSVRLSLFTSTLQCVIGILHHTVHSAEKLTLPLLAGCLPKIATDHFQSCSDKRLKTKIPEVNVFRIRHYQNIRSVELHEVIEISLSWLCTTSNLQSAVWKNELWRFQLNVDQIPMVSYTLQIKHFDRNKQQC